MTLHWRQLVLGVEIIVLVVAAFVPEQFNDMVNAGGVLRLAPCR